MSNLFNHILALVLTLIIGSAGLTQQDYEYLFARVVPGSHISIERLIISGPSSSEILAEVAIPEGLALLNAELSEAGDKILFQFVQPMGPQAQLVFLNLVTSASVSTNIFTIPAPSSRRMVDTYAVFYWSPDAQHAAFIGVDERRDTHGETSVYMVDAVTGLIRPLNLGAGAPLFVAWSPDSSRLAIVEASAGQVPPVIEIYSINMDTSTSNVDMSAVTRNLTDPADVCNLSWSPDARYLTLVYSCAGGNPEISKRVFYIDLEQNQIQQLTDFSNNPRVSGPIDDRFAAYDLQWLNDDLLVSVDFYDGSVRRTETWLYDLASLSGQKLTDGFALDIVNSPAAARVIIPVEGDMVSDAILNLDQAVFSTLDLTLTSQTLCHSQWDPSGQYLAASSHERISQPTRTCSTDPSSILITNAAGEVKFRLDVEPGERIIPLGWSMQEQR